MIGQRVGGYTVIAASGDRYLAVHDTLARRVIIERDDGRTPIVHPGIARVVDRGELDGKAWRAIEIADGTPLVAIARCRRMLAAEAAMLVRDVADVLAHAHERGACHGNLTIDAITRTFDGVSVRWGNGAGEPAADVYALAAIVHRLIGGETHADLALLLTAMLAKDPAARPTAARARTAAAALASQLTNPDDRIGGGPRFKRPKWTPPPEKVGHAIDSAPVGTVDRGRRS